MNVQHHADQQIAGLEKMLAERAVLRTAGQAIDAAVRPAFEAQRATHYPALARDLRMPFDADLGSFNAHPADPRTQPDDLVGNMLEQINCAEQALHMARLALQGAGRQVSTVAARQLMEEARGFLEVPR